VLAKLDRVMPHVSTRLATTRRSIASSAGDDAYGEMKSGTRVLWIAVVSAVALLAPTIAAPAFKVDLSSETAGVEPKSLVPVVGIWRIETEGSKADSYMHFDEFAATASE
jgi:hypothetical protein